MEPYALRIIKVNGEEFDVADYLRNVRNNENDPDSIPVFDVCTKAEALAIEKREKREREEKNSPDKAEEIGGLNNPVAGHSRHAEDRVEGQARPPRQRRESNAGEEGGTLCVRYTQRFAGILR